MPEGDTIFRTAAALRKVLLGQTITSFSTSLDVIRDIDLNSQVVGRSVSAIKPLGKHLMMVLRRHNLSNVDLLDEPIAVPSGWDIDLVRGDLVLHSHMRMTGSWHIYRPDETWQKPTSYARVVLATKDFVAPCFSAPVVELLTAREAVRHPMLTTRGTDAITDDFDPEQAFQQFRKRSDVPIGVALMSQRVMSGVGNVFKSEALYIRRLNPFNSVGSLDDPSLRALIAECHHLLQINQTSGVRRTRFGLDAKQRLWVYGRSGEACFTCGTCIKMKRQGLDGRSTYYCPKCQTGV